MEYAIELVVDTDDNGDASMRWECQDPVNDGHKVRCYVVPFENEGYVSFYVTGRAIRLSPEMYGTIAHVLTNGTIELQDFHWPKPRLNTKHFNEMASAIARWAYSHLEDERIQGYVEGSIERFEKSLARL